jgi:hypothetical protein
MKTPIGDILESASADGVLLEPEGQGGRYALVPLDDDLIDYLLERNSKLAEICKQIRERMQAGQFHTHEEVVKMLASE